MHNSHSETDHLDYNTRTLKTSIHLFHLFFIDERGRNKRFQVTRRACEACMQYAMHACIEEAQRGKRPLLRLCR